MDINDMEPIPAANTASNINLDELSKQEIFKNADLDTVLPLLNKCPVKLIKRDETLVQSGEINHCIYLTLSGRFRVVVPTDVSNPLTMVEAGQSFGDISVISHDISTASIIADIDSRVLIIDEDTLWSLIEHSHIIAKNMLTILAQRLRYGSTVITQIKELLGEYKYNAMVDPLTSLYNRRWLDNALERVMRRCKNDHQPLSVLMIDIDHFKQYNDIHGHIAGDRALRTISRTILHNLRPEDMVTRYGGEELFALLPGLDSKAAQIVAERLRTAISQAKILSKDDTLLPSLTASVGIAQMRQQDIPEQIIHAADQALYRAKHGGKNAVSQ